MKVSHPENCFHCGLPIPTGECIPVQQGEVRFYFCCNGCSGAFQWIHAARLGAYYERRDVESIGCRPDGKEQQRYAPFDAPSFQERYVRQGEGFYEISLMLKGIHCPACIWLNESVLRGLRGVIQANVNFATQRGVVRWDPHQLKLSDILAAIHRLGYRAEPYDPDSVERIQGKRDRDLLLRMGVAGFGATNVMFIAVALYAGHFQGMDLPVRNFFHWVSLVIATPVVFYSGWPFFSAAWSGLRAGRLGMDLPIAIGAGVTYSASVFSTLRGGSEIYFDSVTMFLFILLSGRYLENAARRKAAGSAERLLSLAPRTAWVLRQDQWLEIPVREVGVGDRLQVKPGEKIPVDGEITLGCTAIDASMLTGESLPLAKAVGDTVMGGTLNVDGVFEMRATRVGDDSTWARIASLVDAALTDRSPIQTLADRIAGGFVAGILVLALATFVYWWWIGSDQALLHTVSLLIISCPCALGLATPAAVVVAAGEAARQGVLIKSGAILESLARIDTIVFDKTGTVTEGNLKVMFLHPLPGVDALTLLQNAALAEWGSEHPVGRAIVLEAQKRGIIMTEQPSHCISHPGWGVVAQTPQGSLLIGRPAFVEKQLNRSVGIAPHPEQNVTWVICCRDSVVLGWIGLSDQVKAEAKEVINIMHRWGLRVGLLSGDVRGVVLDVARQLAISEWQSDVSPEQKSLYIQDLKRSGHTVAMVGDGINDTPALARAHVSIAMASGAESASEVADVVLLNNRLQTVVVAIELSRRTLRIIKQNFLISLGYNSIAIPLAIMGYVHPLGAAIAMPISSLLVIGNALLLRRKPKHCQPRWIRF